MNDPIAWMVVNNDGREAFVTADPMLANVNIGQRALPLYTAPHPAKPAEQEPVQEPYAWHYTNNAGASVWHRGPSNRLDADMQAARDYPHVHKITTLYTTPQQRQPLTDEQTLNAVREQAKLEERERCAKIVDVPPYTEAWEVIGGEEGLIMLRGLAAQIRETKE